MTDLALRRRSGKRRSNALSVSRGSTALELDVEFDKNQVPKKLGELLILVGHPHGEGAATYTLTSLTDTVSLVLTLFPCRPSA